jgi:hypothetical protein
VTDIGSYAFYNCNKLYEVYNKSDLNIVVGSEENGYVAYYAKNVYTDESGESKLHTVDDYLFYADGDDIDLLAYVGDKTELTLPSDYEGKSYEIADCAFSDCSGLTSVTIPDSVSSIGSYAFYYCSGLTSVTSMNTTPPSVGGSDTFYKVDKSIPLFVPKQSVEAYKSAKGWKDFTNIIGCYVVKLVAENGTVTGIGVYEENTDVTLTATADEGYRFVKWSDGVEDATRTITVTEDVELTALFEVDNSPISDVEADNVSIRLMGNRLVVEGADSYSVYAVNGQCLGMVESLERGIYIVVADGVREKIIVR